MIAVLAFVVACAFCFGLLLLLDVLLVRWMQGGSDDAPAPAAEKSPALPDVRYTDIRRCAAHGGPIEEDFPVEVHTDIALYDREHPLAVTLFICQPCTSVASYGR